MLRYFDVQNHLCSLWNTEFSFSSLSLMAFRKCLLGWGLACALICGQGPAHRPHTANATVLSWQRTLRNAERATSRSFLNYKICLDGWLKAIWTCLWPPLWPSSIFRKQISPQLIAKNNLKVSKAIWREISTRTKSPRILEREQLIEQRQSWSLEGPVALKVIPGGVRLGEVGLESSWFHQSL